jgi:hypothetical protein
MALRLPQWTQRPPEGESSKQSELQEARTASVFAAASLPGAHWDGILKPAIESLWYGEGAVV